MSLFSYFFPPNDVLSLIKFVVLCLELIYILKHGFVIRIEIIVNKYHDGLKMKQKSPER